MKLSVIIPCYNAAETIAAQVDALASQEWNEEWEVIVSDNGSTDYSMKIVERYRERLPHLIITQAHGRRGGAHAINVGASMASGEYLVFCDADDEVAPGWLAAIGEALREHDIVASKFDFETLNPSWTQTRMWMAQQEGLLTARFYPNFVHAGSCGLGIKRSLFEAIHGFDETIPVLWDTDLCFKAQLAGAQFYFASDAVVFIRQRNKLLSAFHQSRQWAEYNVLIYRRYRVPEKTFPRPWKLYFTLWRGLLLQLLFIRRREDWAKCVWAIGWLIGLLQGSIVFRAPPLPI
jgi:GT2 family glycosyltransferase